MNIPSVQKSIFPYFWLCSSAMLDVFKLPCVDRKVDGLPLTCMSRTDQAWLQTASAMWAAVAMRLES